MSLDKLTALLERAKIAAKRAERAAEQAAESKLRNNHRAAIARETALCAVDYASRLAERAKFRELLRADRLDGERFRWYFSHIENSQDLDSLRKWIDGKMSRASRAPNA